MATQNNLNSLLTLGLGAKKDVPCLIERSRNIVQEFTHGKIDVLVVECACDGSYDSKLQADLIKAFPTLGESLSKLSVDDRLLGQIVPIRIPNRNKNRYIVNAYTRMGSGWGKRSLRVKSESGELLPLDHYDPAAIESAFTSILTGFKDYRIGCIRFLRGVGGTHWSTLRGQLSELVERVNGPDLYVFGHSRDPDQGVILGSNEGLKTSKPL